MSGDKLLSSIGSLLQPRKKRTATDFDDRVDGGNGVHRRTRSVDGRLDVTEVAEVELEGEEWTELKLVKSISPVVMCVLPSAARDIVGSVLLAIGAYPLLTEESEDIPSHLKSAQVILLDTSAKRELVKTLMEHYVAGTVPLVLSCWESGTNDTRKALTRVAIEQCKPTVISGRMGDVHALSLDIMNRAEGIISAEDDIDQGPERKSKPPLVATASAERASSPRFMRKKDAAVRSLQRQKTAIPQMVLKGHFRHKSIKDISVPVALTSARKLATQLGCLVHLYEANVITGGEFFFEINNLQMGMDNLLYIVQCAAGIIATVVGCLDEQGEEITLCNCGHALCLFHVAAEDAAISVTSKSELVSPGSLRVAFIDTCHKLTENDVRFKSKIVFHNSPPTH